MARVTHAASHLPLAEVKNRMRTDPHTDRRHSFLIIYNALVQPRRASEIARHCGVSKATVHAVISRYNRLGIAAIETPGKTPVLAVLETDRRAAHSVPRRILPRTK